MNSAFKVLDEMQGCIENCWNCRHACQTTLFNHCLEVGGTHVAPEHVKLMTDCIQICQLAADAMVRQSPQYADICAACAKICEACAESCEALDTPEMKHCAETCRQCADICGGMGSMQKVGSTARTNPEGRVMA